MAIKKKKPPSAKAGTPAFAATTPLDDLAHIAPGLRSLAVSIDTLSFDPRNARKHNERNRRSIVTSLTRFGQQKPIVVDANDVVRAGNGTLEAARAMGWKYIAAARTHLSGSELTAFAIADNRTAELAEWDAEELREQLDELGDVGIGLEDLEFTSEELDKLLDQAADSQITGGGDGEAVSGGALKDQFKIVIDCGTERKQTSLLERFEAEGLKCKALVS